LITVIVGKFLNMKKDCCFASSIKVNKADEVKKMAFQGMSRRISPAFKAVSTAIEQSPTASGTAATLLGAGVLTGGAFIYETMVPSKSETVANETALRGQNDQLLKLMEKQMDIYKEVLETANQRAAMAEARAQKSEQAIAALQNEVASLKAPKPSWNPLAPFFSHSAAKSSESSADKGQTGASPSGPMR
jgi:uncharacterized protein HemX